MVKIPSPMELLGAAKPAAKAFDAEAYRRQLETMTTAELKVLASREGVPNLHSRLVKGDYVNRLIMHAKNRKD